MQLPERHAQKNDCFVSFSNIDFLKAHIKLISCIILPNNKKRILSWITFQLVIDIEMLHGIVWRKIFFTCKHRQITFSDLISPKKRRVIRYINEHHSILIRKKEEWLILHCRFSFVWIFDFYFFSLCNHGGLNIIICYTMMV